MQQGKVTGCVNFKGPSQGLGPAPGAGPRAWGCKLQGLGAPLWAGASRGLGPGPQDLGARAACDQFFAVLKSLGRGLVKGWESAE